MVSMVKIDHLFRFLRVYILEKYPFLNTPWIALTTWVRYGWKNCLKCHLFTESFSQTMSNMKNTWKRVCERKLMNTDNAHAEPVRTAAILLWRRPPLAYSSSNFLNSLHKLGKVENRITVKYIQDLYYVKTFLRHPSQFCLAQMCKNLLVS